MSYEFGSSLAPFAPVIISPWSEFSIGTTLVNFAGAVGASSQNWIAANVVVYVPFWVPESYTLTRLWWANDSAVSGNIDVGVYNTDATLVISAGTTAQTPVNVIQSVNIADTTIARGSYYMAMVSDTSAVGQKVRAGTFAFGGYQSLGLLEQASVTLPLATNASPATFAKYTRAFCPFFGVEGYRGIAP